MVEIFDEFAAAIQERIAQEKERMNIRALSRALKQFGDKHPEMIGAFRGPYMPSSEHEIHIVIPQSRNPKQRKPYTMFGFDTRSGRYFSVEIPSKKLTEFLADATESRRREAGGIEAYYSISSTFSFSEVSKQTFVEAFTGALGDIPVSEAEGVRNALDAFPELAHLNKHNFFGPQVSGPPHMGFGPYPLPDKDMP